jgi:hypothetical protein
MLDDEDRCRVSSGRTVLIKEKKRDDPSALWEKDPLARSQKPDPLKICRLNNHHCVGSTSPTNYNTTQTPLDGSMS